MIFTLSLLPAFALGCGITFYHSPHCYGSKWGSSRKCGQDPVIIKDLDSYASFMITRDCGKVEIYDDDGHWYDGENQNCVVAQGEGISGPCEKGSTDWCFRLQTDLQNDVRGVKLIDAGCDNDYTSASESIWDPPTITEWSRDMETTPGHGPTFMPAVAVALGMFVIVGVVAWRCQATKVVEVAEDVETFEDNYQVA